MNQTIKQKLEKMEDVIKEFREDFRQVTKEAVFTLRMTKKRFGLLKLQEKLYVFPYRTKTEEDKQKTEKIIKKIRSCFNNVHCCSSCANFYNENKECLCPKVADGSEESCRKYTGSDIEAIKESKRMEKYPFIIFGFEEVNVSEGSFIVMMCNDFEEEKRDPKREKESLVGGAEYHDSNPYKPESFQRPEYYNVYYNFRFRPR